MKYSTYIRIVVLTLISVHCAAACPLFYRLITDDIGCKQTCRCCYKPASGRPNAIAHYRVDCSHRNLDKVPQVPQNVTYLNLEHNPIEHLDRNSFPWLPKLLTLKLGNAGRPYEQPSFPLKTASSDALRNLPKLYGMYLTLQLKEVTSFLNSAKHLKSVHLRCAQSMEEQEYKTLFAGLYLADLLTEECDFPLEEDVFETAPDEFQYTPTSAVSHIDLPKTELIYTANGSMNECLNLTSVNVKSLYMYCVADVMDVTPHSLDWIDRTRANIYLRLYAPRYQQLRLANHTINFLDIWTGPTFEQEQNFTHDLLTSLPNMAAGKLRLRSLAPFPRYAVLGESKLRNLIGPAVRDLELAEYRIGRIDNFNFNLESFKCYQCLIYCRNCLKAPNLTKFSTDDTRSTFLVDLNRVLLDHPKLTKLCLRSFKVVVPTFDFQYHKTIEHLEIWSSLPVNNSNYSRLNFTGLVNLKFVSIRHLVFPTVAVPSSNFTFAGLEKLQYLEMAYNMNLTVTGPLDDVFKGLKTLTNLKLKRNPFWKSGDRRSSSERLSRLLLPVAKTLQLLNLKENNIEDIPGDLFAEMVNLRYLSLYNNKISTLDGNWFRHSPRLNELLMNKNLIENIDAKTVKLLSQMKYLQLFFLEDNRLRCTCENRKLRNWIRKDKDQNLQIIKYDAPCYGPYGFHSEGVMFTDYTMPWLDCDNHTELLILILVFGTFLLLMGSMIAAYYYRYDIMFWWVVKRPHRINRRYRIDPGKQYHAFLSYTGSEQELADHIFRQLEEGEDVQFKIAYDCRDFRPGITIADNIIRCIDQSEKVIFLISRQFLQREWTTFELNFAQMRCFDERRNLIILIFIEQFTKAELPRRLRTLERQVNCLYLHNQHDSRAVQNFWHRLRIALTQDSEIEVARGPVTPQLMETNELDLENDPFMPSRPREPLLTPSTPENSTFTY